MGWADEEPAMASSDPLVPATASVVGALETLEKGSGSPIPSWRAPSKTPKSEIATTSAVPRTFREWLTLIPSS